MNRIWTTLRAGTGATLAALMVTALLPGVAAAATRPVTFSLYVGADCVSGRASDGATVQLIWKSGDGTRKANVAIHASSSGYWYYCSYDGDTVAIGDRVRANDGTSGRFLVVPQLTLVIDRVDNVFKGRGPAGDYVRLFCGYTNGFEPCIQSWKLKVSSHGRWAYKPPWDVVGWQSMSVRWKSGEADEVWVGASGPYVDVTIGSAIVRGSTRANATATVVLRRAGSSDVAGTAVTTSDERGDFTAKFRNANGNLVNVHVGDRITSDVSPDEDWTVPNVIGDADADADRVTGTCPAESFFVEAIAGSDSAYTWPEDDGSFQLEVASTVGQKVRVHCYLDDPGDWVGRLITAN